MLFLAAGTGQNMFGLNWGNGFITDVDIINSRGLSNPNKFFQSLLKKPYARKVSGSGIHSSSNTLTCTWVCTLDPVNRGLSGCTCRLASEAPAVCYSACLGAFKLMMEPAQHIKNTVAA